MSLALPSRTTRRTAARTTGVALALALGLSGCGAGLRAQTYQERAASDSTNEAAGSIAVRDVRVLPPRTGDGYAVGASAPVSVTFVNEGDAADRLTSASSDGATSVVVDGPGGQADGVDLPPQQLVSQYGLVLQGLTRELQPGQYVKLELTFRDNGTLSLLVPVQLTGSPAPRVSGYEVGETDSTGKVLPEQGR